MDKIIIVAALAAAVYLTAPKKAAPAAITNGNPVSTYVPWYLTYNFPAGFTSGHVPLPNNALGQDSATGSGGGADIGAGDGGSGICYIASGRRERTYY